MRKIARVALAAVLVVAMVAPVTAMSYIYQVSTRNITVVQAVPGDVFDFEDNTQGWQHQTWVDTQAITAVNRTTDRAKVGVGSLQCTVNLIGGHANFSKGEAWVDMQNNPPPAITVPVDFSTATVSVWLYLPAGAVGDTSKPNGIQLFFKDTSWRNKYSSWKNIGSDIPTGQWSQVTVNMATESWAWDDGCDLTQVRVLGVKIGAGGGSTATFSGSMWIDAYDW